MRQEAEGALIYRFSKFALDTELLELGSAEGPVAVEPQVFTLLVYLIENRSHVVSKEELIRGVWKGRNVSDDTLHSRINAARHAIGDTGTAQAIIRTLPKRGFRFVADVEEIASPSPSGAQLANEMRGSDKALRLEPAQVQQEIRYCRTPDGVRLAFAVAGSGPPVVKAGNWLNHLEYDWESPFWRHTFRRLTRDYTLIRYDPRGNGLSDWDVTELSLDAWVSDLETVVDAAGIERFALLGISQGCAACVTYAVRHPERVSHLILYGGYAIGRNKRSSSEKEQTEAMVTLARLGWGQDNPAFRQMFTWLFIPGATSEQMDFFSELQRKTTSPECAARTYSAAGDIDVTNLLGKVTTPTLVMHARGDAVVPIECGRQVAEGIPGARFVAFQGKNHVLLEHEPGFDRFFEEIRLFLGH